MTTSKTIRIKWTSQIIFVYAKFFLLNLYRLFYYFTQHKNSDQNPSFHVLLLYIDNSVRSRKNKAFKREQPCKFSGLGRKENLHITIIDSIERHKLEIDYDLVPAFSSSIRIFNHFTSFCFLSFDNQTFIFIIRRRILDLSCLTEFRWCNLLRLISLAFRFFARLMLWSCKIFLIAFIFASILSRLGGQYLEVPGCSPLCMLQQVNFGKFGKLDKVFLVVFYLKNKIRNAFFFPFNLVQYPLPLDIFLLILHGL